MSYRRVKLEYKGFTRINHHKGSCGGRYYENLDKEVGCMSWNAKYLLTGRLVN
ncbi:hypothetical protein HanPI659440_Chr11g0415581 [Helianthus annuus]|nr:hypothetical protein HanPI659440_Chr11g0415581 [Helianthus annuus]